MKIVQTNNSNQDFIKLISHLDDELNSKYGSKQSEYDQHNRIDPIETVIIGYINGEAVACGCFKTINRETIEIKRMFVKQAHRRNGYSVEILKKLENLASTLGYSKSILETGKGQPDAVGLYIKCGYKLIENYGPYKGMENSVCMEKLI